MIALEKRRHDWLFATLHTVVVFLCFVLLICLCVCLFYIDLVIQQARYKITLSDITKYSCSVTCPVITNHLALSFTTPVAILCLSMCIIKTEILCLEL